MRLFSMGAMMGNAMKHVLTARTARGAVIASASLALAGCISLGAKVPEQLLRLTPESGAEVGSQATGQLSEAIVVLDPEADRSLDVLRVPVQVSDSSIAYLKDASWVEKPARQFRGVLAEAIRTATDRLVVEGTEYEVTGRTLVGGRLQRMGYDAATGAVIVRFDALRRERGGAIATRRFEAVVNDVKPEAAWVGPALNQAANDVARQVAGWIKGE